MAETAVVGCGFVGSLFLEEAFKLCFAGELFPTWRLIDSDIFERRNAANQNVPLTVAHEGLPKAEVMARLAKQYEAPATAHHLRVTRDNIDELLGEASLVVDAVDNLATRQLLWGYCLGRQIPCLHLGITETGTGTVEWSHPEHDTFALAPHRVGSRVITDPESGVKPPCELAKMRSVGWLTSYAAAIAWAIYWGFDPNGFFESNDAARGFLTNWETNGQQLIPARSYWRALEVV